MKYSDYRTFPIQVNELKTNYLYEGLWIVLIHSKRVPPHVAILQNGMYYSLNLKGPESNIPVDKIIKVLKQKKIESLFLQLIHKSSTPKELPFDKVLLCFPKINKEITCLSPVKKYLSLCYPVRYLKKELAPDLIHRLYQKNLIVSAFSLNLSVLNKHIEIANYNQEQLNKGLSRIIKENQ